MSNVSEQISELSATLLLNAMGELASIAYRVEEGVFDVGRDAAYAARKQMIAVINSLQEQKLTKKNEDALNKIKAAVTGGETPRQVTFEERDREILEKWLTKQNVLYATVESNEQSVELGQKKNVLFFLEKDAAAVHTALALTSHERGYINELPPQAMLFLHKNKNLSVVDGLNVYELEVFREVAKSFGLVYSAMLNPPDSNPSDKDGVSDTYKIVASKKDAKMVAAVMQQVVWSMTGEYQDGIKEMVKEHYSIKAEIQKLISEGIGPDRVYLTNNAGETFAIENAKYIVNAKAPSQYIKLTKEGFEHHKFGKVVEKVSKGEESYEDKLQFALSEFSNAVIFDAAEWERENLGKDNLRKNRVLEKLSVFPKGYDKEKEARELQKARKKEHEQVPETAWLFDRYDTAKLYSEVYEANYNDYSEPPEKTVSVHFGEAVKASEKYRYIDISKDEKSLESIIAQAKEKSIGSETYDVYEKEFDS